MYSRVSKTWVLVAGCFFIILVVGSIYSVSAPDDPDRLPSSIVVLATDPPDRLPSSIVVLATDPPDRLPSSMYVLKL